MSVSFDWDPLSIYKNCFSKFELTGIDFNYFY